MTKEILEYIEELFIKHGSVKTYKRNSIIYYQGDECEGIYFVLKGIVKVVKIDDRYNKIVKSFFKYGDLTGESALIRDVCYPANLETSDYECKLVFVNREKFNSILLRDEIFVKYILKSLSDKNLMHDNLLSKFLSSNVTSRVAKFLYKDLEIFNSLKNYEVAEALKTSPETLSRTITKLKKSNIIKEVHHKIEVVDTKKLYELI